MSAQDASSIKLTRRMSSASRTNSLAEHLQFGENVVLVAESGRLLRVRAENSRWTLAAERGAFHGSSFPSDAVLIILKAQDSKYVGFCSAYADSKLLQASGEPDLPPRFDSHYLGEAEQWSVSGKSFHKCILTNKKFPDKKLLIMLQRILRIESGAVPFPSPEFQDLAISPSPRERSRVQPIGGSNVETLDPPVEESTDGGAQANGSEEGESTHVAGSYRVWHTAAANGEMPAGQVQKAKKKTPTLDEEVRKLREMNFAAEAANLNLRRRLESVDQQAAENFAKMTSLEAELLESKRRGEENLLKAMAELEGKLETKVEKKLEKNFAALIERERRESEEKIAKTRKEAEGIAMKKISEKLARLETVIKEFEEKLAESNGDGKWGIWEKKEDEWRFKIIQEQANIAQLRMEEMAVSLRQAEIERISLEEKSKRFGNLAAARIAELETKVSHLEREKEVLLLRECENPGEGFTDQILGSTSEAKFLGNVEDMETELKSVDGAPCQQARQRARGHASEGGRGRSAGEAWGEGSWEGREWEGQALGGDVEWMKAVVVNTCVGETKVVRKGEDYDVKGIAESGGGWDMSWWWKTGEGEREEEDKAVVLVGDGILERVRRMGSVELEGVEREGLTKAEKVDDGEVGLFWFWDALTELKKEDPMGEGVGEGEGEGEGAGEGRVREEAKKGELSKGVESTEPAKVKECEGEAENAVNCEAVASVQAPSLETRPQSTNEVEDLDDCGRCLGKLPDEKICSVNAGLVVSSNPSLSFLVGTISFWMILLGFLFVGFSAGSSSRKAC